MNEKELKSQRDYLLNMKRSAAKPINKQFSDVENVHILAIASFSSPFTGLIEKRYELTLSPSNLLYAHFPCVNRDCTGAGYDITDKIRECLKEHKSIEGNIQCDGKEDWKYIGHSGCSCQSELNYQIIPSFSSAHGNDEASNRL